MAHSDMTVRPALSQCVSWTPGPGEAADCTHSGQLGRWGRGTFGLRSWRGALGCHLLLSPAPFALLRWPGHLRGICGARCVHVQMSPCRRAWVRRYMDSCCCMPYHRLAQHQAMPLRVGGVIHGQSLGSAGTLEARTASATRSGARLPACKQRLACSICTDLTAHLPQRRHCIFILRAKIP
jgi:hypothetical protein